MSNKIKYQEEQEDFEENGRKTWVKIVFIIIGIIFIIGMIVPFALLK